MPEKPPPNGHGKAPPAGVLKALMDEVGGFGPSGNPVGKLLHLSALAAALAPFFNDPKAFSIEAIPTVRTDDEIILQVRFRRKPKVVPPKKK